MLFQQFLTHQCVKPTDFNLSWLAQLATSNFSHVSQIRTVMQFLPVCVAERRSPSHVDSKTGLLLKTCFDTLLSSAAFLLACRLVPHTIKVCPNKIWTVYLTRSVRALLLSYALKRLYTTKTTMTRHHALTPPKLRIIGYLTESVLVSGKR